MSVPKLRGRPGGSTLAALLQSNRFRLGRDTARVAQNLSLHGGLADEGAASWIGSDLPPLGAPSVTLGSARGTLGPHSFGFLDNTREGGPAPYAAPLAQRPRRGPIAIVCGRRDALPDVAPLAVARGLGVSWILSTGDGDPDEALAFLANDPHTRAVLLAAGAKTKPGCLAALGGKPAVVLGGDPLLRAAARRAGGADAADLESWLAHAALLEAGVAAPASPVALVVGGGATLVEQAARASGLTVPVRAVSDDDPEEIERAVADAAAQGDLLIVVTAEPIARPASPVVVVDPGHLERLRAIAAAVLLGRTAVAPAPAPRAEADRQQVGAVLDGAGDELSDHDTKRLLKAYGCRVSRQAPANSATAATRVASQIGGAVEVVAGAVPGARAGASRRPASRRAATVAEVRHATALLLEDAPFVLVREAFPDAPRARLVVRREKGLGAWTAIEGEGDERALLPLERADAVLLARRAGAAEEKPLADLLLRACAAATECDLSLELELFVGDAPAIIAASATRARRSN